MALDSHVYTILEPSIKLDEMQMPNAGEADTGDAISDELGGEGQPLIRINDHQFARRSVLNFTLDLNGKYPELTATLLDIGGDLTVDRFPRDGDLLNLRIHLDEAGTYKDIRMDFTILEFKGRPTSADEAVGGETTYNVRAIAKIPGMWTDDCRSYGEGSSLDHVKSMAQELKLGLATNIGETNDVMRRFCAYQTKLETIANTVLHSYVSDDAFQTYSIDPYYYINFVDLQKVFNAPEDVELHEMISTFKFNERGTDPKAFSGDRETPLLLTNHHEANMVNTKIEKHNLVNNSTKIALENGYKRKMQYFDHANTDLNLVEFDVESLVSDNIKDNEEPLKGRRNSEVDEYSTHIKQKYMGIQSDATHINYNFAAMNNIQNMVELDKMYLEVELKTLNPALYRYMKVPVSIYNYAEDAIDKTLHVNEKAKEAGFDVQADENGTDEERDKAVRKETFTLDEFLSGYYVIMGIKYKYNDDDGYTQTLKLARREWPARLNNM